MPVDTRSKRASALSALRSWILTPPLPDGTLDQGDRQHVAFMYSGILAAAAVIVERIVVGLESIHAYPRVGVVSLESFPDVGIDSLEAYPR